jgi:hypothetical protein
MKTDFFQDLEKNLGQWNGPKNRVQKFLWPTRTLEFETLLLTVYWSFKTKTPHKRCQHQLLFCTDDIRIGNDDWSFAPFPSVSFLFPNASAETKTRLVPFFNGLLVWKLIRVTVHHPIIISHHKKYFFVSVFFCVLFFFFGGVCLFFFAELITFSRTHTPCWWGVLCSWSCWVVVWCRVKVRVRARAKVLVLVLGVGVGLGFDLVWVWVWVWVWVKLIYHKQEDTRQEPNPTQDTKAKSKTEDKKHTANTRKIRTRVLSCVVLCCVILSCLSLSYLTLSYLVLVCLVLVLSCLVLSCLAFNKLILSCINFFRLSCRVVSCRVLFWNGSLP